MKEIELEDLITEIFLDELKVRFYNLNRKINIIETHVDRIRHSSTDEEHVAELKKFLDLFDADSGKFIGDDDEKF